MKLPPRAGQVPLAPVQRTCDRAAEAARQREVESATWMEVIMRPDLHEEPVQRAGAGEVTGRELPHDGAGKAAQGERVRSQGAPAGVSRPKGVVQNKVVQRALLPDVGDSAYRHAADKNLAFEEEIGKALIMNGDVTELARKIRLYSGAPMDVASMKAEDKAELSHLIGSIGGAKDLSEDRPTLDAHVLATHIKLDRAEFNDPNAPNPNRRANMFNRVTSPENPIFPWNIHGFDMDIFAVERWEDYPEVMQGSITERWERDRLDDLKYAQVFSLASLARVTGLSAMSAKDIIPLLTAQERKTFLLDILDIRWSTTTFTEDERADNTARDTNPLGPCFRQHNTGYRANVVRDFDPKDPSVEKWVERAIGAKKPIVSGPSGHTLRYLNFWASVRMYGHLVNQTFSCLLRHPVTLFDMTDYPSLVEARFVMMANLLPPKYHHSYHEIMGASIGVSDGVETLTYPNPDSYEDLKIHAIGRAAFEQATKALGKPSAEPLPNPWTTHGNAPRLDGWPPPTPEKLAYLLYRFGSNEEMVERLIMAASPSVRLGVVPVVRKACTDGLITAEQRDTVLDMITEASVIKPIRDGV